MRLLRRSKATFGNAVESMESGAWERPKILAGRSPRYKASGQVRRHLAADLGDGLIYREAFTTSAADQVIDHLVNACGLRPDRDAVPAPGKIVFVYRKTAGVPAALGSDQAALHKVAA